MAAEGEPSAEPTVVSDAVLPAAAASEEAIEAHAGSLGARRTTSRGRSAALVSAATLASRVLGLVREQVFATLFGAGLATDAFNVAFRIPNLLRDLFAEGAMSSAFVPTFTEELTLHGRARAFRLASMVMTVLACVTGALVVLGILFAEPLARVMAPGFAHVPGKLELTVFLTRIMMPFLLLIALGAAATGVLNALSSFAVPALAPGMISVGMIVAGVGLVPVARRFGLPPIVGMAVGTVLGVLGQVLVHIPAFIKEGYKPRVIWAPTDPGVRRVIFLMLPATIGLAATQINLLVNTQIASLLAQGSVSWLNYAFRLMYLPIGVFGVAVATVTLPALARAIAVQDMVRMKEELAGALRLVAFLTLPATAGLAALATPIIRLLYQHGRFTPYDTYQTAGALLWYCTGLAAYSAVKVVVPTYYALKDTRTPVAVSMLAVCLNIALNVALMHVLKHRGLALATSATMTFNLVCLLFLLRRRIGPLGLRSVANAVARIGVASAIMGVAVWAIERQLEHVFGTTRLLARAGTLGVSVGFGIVLLYALAHLLHVEETEMATGALRRLMGRLTPRRTARRRR
jgi:putative peptidoglycan lipid II flippase